MVVHERFSKQALLKWWDVIFDFLLGGGDGFLVFVANACFLFAANVQVSSGCLLLRIKRVQRYLWGSAVARKSFKEQASHLIRPCFPELERLAVVWFSLSIVRRTRTRCANMSLWDGPSSHPASRFAFLAPCEAMDVVMLAAQSGTHRRCLVLLRGIHFLSLQKMAFMSMFLTTRQPENSPLRTNLTSYTPLGSLSSHDLAINP